MNNIFTTSTGEEVPIIIETRRGLRNITLRPCVTPRREIRISKPWLATSGAAMRFVAQKRAWLEKYFSRAPTKIKISDGDIIEFLGRRVRIVHNPKIRSNNYITTTPSAPQTFGGSEISVGHRHPFADEGELQIGGDAAHLERRVRDFIKSEFLAAVKEIIKTAPPEFRPKRIALRDTTSRWGSCSTTGTISFSWRLAFAPTDVTRYVVMHELAHCKHMDHSAEFWGCVATLYGPGVERAKRWLTQNGAELHKFL